MVLHILSRFGRRLVLVSLVLAPFQSWLAGPAVAQIPPARAASVIEDSLTQPTIVDTSTCPTGNGGREVTAAGLRLWLSGRCLASDGSALVTQSIRDLRLRDGGIRVQLTMDGVAGQSEARIELHRESPSRSGIVVAVNPAAGRASILRFGEGAAMLAERQDLGAIFSTSGTNVVEVRALGPELWLLLNDGPVLSVRAEPEATYSVRLGLERMGPADAQSTSSVTFRDLAAYSVVGATRVTAIVPNSPTAARAIPPIGAPVLTNTLSGGGAFLAGGCATGRGSGEYTSAGFVVRVNGRCSDGATTATMVAPAVGVRMQDGDVSFDIRFEQGASRAHLSMLVRMDETDRTALVYLLDVDRRAASVAKFAPGAASALSINVDLSRALRDDWNTISIRMSGASQWLIVNDQLIATTSDSTTNGKLVFLGLTRSGDVNDDEEVRAVVRNLRVAPLADGDPARGPVYDPNSPPAGRAAPATEPRCAMGYPKLVREMDGRDVWYCTHD